MNPCINEQACAKQAQNGQDPVGQLGMAIGDTARRVETVTVNVEVRAESDFSSALEATIYQRKRITRAGWNGPGQWVAMNRGTPGINAPYLQMMNTKGLLVPWVPSQGDLFATDWAALP